MLRRNSLELVTFDLEIFVNASYDSSFGIRFSSEIFSGLFYLGFPGRAFYV